MADTATTSLQLPTPSLTYAARRTYDVEIARFIDGSEQRFLRSDERGMSLFYEYTLADSATTADIVAVWDAAQGPLGCFWARDYQDDTDYLVRFRHNRLPIRRGVINRQLPTIELRVVSAVEPA